MATRPPRRTPKLTALHSTDEELDRAAAITPEDTALVGRRAPASIRPYLEAEPEAEPEPGDEA